MLRHRSGNCNFLPAYLGFSVFFLIGLGKGRNQGNGETCIFFSKIGNYFLHDLDTESSPCISFTVIAKFVFCKKRSGLQKQIRFSRTRILSCGQGLICVFRAGVLSCRYGSQVCLVEDRGNNHDNQPGISVKLAMSK